MTYFKNRKRTRFFAICLSLILTMSVFTACGEEEQPESFPGFTLDGGSNATGNSGSGVLEHSDSMATGIGLGADTMADEQQAIKDAFYADNGQGSAPVWAGVQLYNGDVVNVWRKMNGSEDLQKAQDIYLYDSDDNGKMIARGVPSTCVGSWFYTNEGYLLNVMGSKLLMFDESGNEKFNISAEGGVGSIVQLSDNTIVLLVKASDNSHTLAILDIEKGEYEKVPNLDLGKDRRVFLSADDTGVVVLNQTGFWNVNLETGELTERIALSEYDFTPDYTLKTFQMQGGGAVKLLYQEATEMVMPVDIEKYRTVVTMQVDEVFIEYGAIKIMVDEFNATHPECYVKLVNYAEFDAGLSNMEAVYDSLAQGAGADLIYTNGMNWNSYMDRAIQQGYLEDLRPYMEYSGIYEEDYFPTAFDSFKVNGGIYGVCYQTGTSGFTFQKDVLGGRDIRSLEDLVDALLAYTGEAVYSTSADSMLWNLIRASDSLAGTVDWESRICDFQGNLFAKLLEVCKFYGNEDYQNKDKYTIMDSIVSTSHFYGYLNEEQRDMAGEVYLGYFFDEGCYPRADIFQTIHMNSSSENKEGAWALIAWLISEEAQSQKNFTANKTLRFLPTNVFAFETVMELERKETSLALVSENGAQTKFHKYITLGGVADWMEVRKMEDEEYRSRFDLKELDAEEIREQLYIARFLPIRTEPIQDIILEEAESYFNDERGLGDTCDAIQARVQAYLDEPE